ncbi:hypothetical protein E2C01_072678 [Portunus trituberculatus]|uniref:Uncharacterized protein n=1 Tax=Portunus trituberculatus TaxID=210409 RepID=A0A5B7I8I1_PORTR|nr:hypothetical protein [Portunus trituberculatus]
MAGNNHNNNGFVPAAFKCPVPHTVLGKEVERARINSMVLGARQCPPAIPLLSPRRGLKGRRVKVLIVAASPSQISKRAITRRDVRGCFVPAASLQPVDLPATEGNVRVFSTGRAAFFVVIGKCGRRL